MKKGFTLIELLVYMAIMGFIIVVAGRVFSDATGMRVRTQSMTKAAETVNSTTALLREDLGRMGAKEWKAANQAVFEVNDKVYQNLSGTDTSSFELMRGVDEDGRQRDTIIFNTMDYKDNGEFLAVRKIQYFVDANDSLKRLCETIDGTGNEDCQELTIIASNVESFSLNPSIPGIRPAAGTLAASIDNANKNPVLFSDENFHFIKRPAGNDVVGVNADGDGTSKITLSGFTRNAEGESKFSQVLLANNQAGCKEFEFVPGEIYAIEFDLPYIPSPSSDEICRMCAFQPSEDHIALGLREKTKLDDIIPGVPDFPVYPPQIPTTTNDKVPLTRHQEFSIPMADGLSTFSACVSLTFAFYSQMASGGEISFANFKVERKTNEVYHFATDDEAYEYNPGVTSNTTVLNKAMVKAFELELSVKVKNEITSSKVVVPVPNNGVFAKSTPP